MTLIKPAQVLPCLAILLNCCVQLPPKIIYKDKIIDNPVHIAVQGKTIYIKPPKTEREIIKAPVFKGIKWSDTLKYIIEYQLSLNQCNARIERIWFAVDGFDYE